MNIGLNHAKANQSSDLDCNHCGKSVDLKSAIYHKNNVYCCNGCLGASKLIFSLGLQKYYSIKDFNKHKSEKNHINNNSSLEDYSYLNQENFKRLYTTNKNSNTMKFYIEGIHCTGCLWLIENLSNNNDEIESVELNMSSNIATVKSKKDFSVFPKLVNTLGYKAHPVEINSLPKSIELNESKKLLYRIGIAGFCAGNIMLLSAAIYAGADNFFSSLFEIINAVLILPIITYCSYPFYINVVNSLKHKRTNVDIAVLFIIIVGSILSGINLYYGGETYFDSIAAFVFLLLLSRYVLRYVQKILINKSNISTTSISKSVVLKWDEIAKQYFLTPISDVVAGDRVKFNKGETIPFDGIALSQNSYLDVSVLTGENYPKNVCNGDEIYSGSILESDEITLRVKNTGYETRIGKILKKIEDGSFINKNLSDFTDKYSTVFTLTVATISIIFFIYFTYALSFAESISRTISFILVSCPCAFIFVLPLTYSYSIKSGFNKGFIVKEVSFFDKIRKIKKVFFDKTGTLTNGRYRILKWDSGSLTPIELSEISAVQSKSEHPIAKAITKHIGNKKFNLPKVDEYGPIKQIGFYGKLNNNQYEFVNEPVKDESTFNQLVLTKIKIIKNGIKISEILFGDTLKDDAKLTINRIKELGLTPALISGDRLENVSKIATKLEIPKKDIYFEQSPENKISILQNFEHSVMVGDGLNDSGALSKADIGIAIQGSVEQSLKASDVFLMNKNLTTILELLEHGKSTAKIIRNTVITSLIYNIVAGSFALLGFITPLLAAVLMPSSSLLLLLISYLGHNRLRSVSVC